MIFFNCLGIVNNVLTEYAFSAGQTSVTVLSGIVANDVAGISQHPSFCHPVTCRDTSERARTKFESRSAKCLLKHLLLPLIQPPFLLYICLLLFCLHSYPVTNQAQVPKDNFLKYPPLLWHKFAFYTYLLKG